MKINVFLGHLLIAGLVTGLTACLTGGFPLPFSYPAGCVLPLPEGGHPARLNRTNLLLDLIFWWIVSIVISNLIRNLTGRKEES